MNQKQFKRAYGLWRARLHDRIGEPELFAEARAAGLVDALPLVREITSWRIYRTLDHLSAIQARLTYRDRHPRWKYGDPRGNQRCIPMPGRLP